MEINLRKSKFIGKNQVLYNVNWSPVHLAKQYTLLSLKSCNINVILNIEAKICYKISTKMCLLNSYS